jgi:signal transduction histidine kinase
MDATEIRQLLLNLYRNAEDAIPSKGKVIIRTKRQANGVCLQVEDTGCGIPATHLSRIMEPFYTTKSTGTGLGLAVCRNIAEQHNAQLTITSVEGAGTTVSIVFSLCPEKE